MGETEKVVTSDESTTSMIEQLEKAFDELESQRGSSFQWEDIKKHFRNLDRSLKEKFDELEEKEKAFEEKKSEAWLLIAERKASVAAKEQASLDRLQELKDTAVSAIAKARKNCKTEFAPFDIGGNKEQKVCISASEEKFPDKSSGEVADAVAVEVKPRPQLKQLCEEGDMKGLMQFISDNQKHHVSLRKELSIALKSSSDSARFVLDFLEGFYPPDHPVSQDSEKNTSLQAIRRSCLILIESAASLLGAGADNPLSSEIKQRAKAVADEWKPKLADMDLDASNGNSLEAQAFLQLIVTFGIVSDFDEDELCKFVAAVSRRRQAPGLCRALGLTHRMPGVVEALVNSKRKLDAVNFAYAFHLTESFPPLPLLKSFLNDMGKSTAEMTGDTESADVQELIALRAVVRCIEQHKLQEDYPLSHLQTRVSQLKKEKVDKRMPKATTSQAKKPRVSYEYTPRKPAFTIETRQPHMVFEERGGVYGDGVSERYPYAAPPAYDLPSHASYGQQAGVQRAYHFLDEKARPPALYTQQADVERAYRFPEDKVHPPASYSAPPPSYGAPSSYGGYTNAGLQTAPANHASYAGTGYQSATSNYGSYGSASLQPSHQSYM